jgi:hypothetical protein
MLEAAKYLSTMALCCVGFNRHMSENIDPSLLKSAAQNRLQDLPNRAESERAQLENTQPETILVEVPAALAKILHHCSQQSGQPPAAVIVAILKSAFGLGSDRSQDSLAARLETVEARLNQLESLEVQVEDLEGKLLAF